MSSSTAFFETRATVAGTSHPNPIALTRLLGIGAISPDDILAAEVIHRLTEDMSPDRRAVVMELAKSFESTREILCDRREEIPEPEEGRMIEDRDLYIVFETVSGSNLYGTAISTSDVDVRGVGIPSLRYVMGVEQFEQLETKTPDRTIFSLKKFFDLASDANPNIIELLFVPRRHWRRHSDVWESVLENRSLFLSMKARHTFSGYAFSQLQRIKNHKKWLDNPPEKPDRVAMGLSVECGLQENSLKALAAVPRALIGGLTDMVHQEIEYAKAKREWDAYRDWKDGRNRDRYALEAKYGYDTKHAMHLVRLMRMGVELLETGILNVDRRLIDADELLLVRNGAWAFDDLIAYAEKMDARMTEIYDDPSKHVLPMKPNRAASNALLMDLLCTHFGIKQ